MALFMAANYMVARKCFDWASNGQLVASKKTDQS